MTSPRIRRISALAAASALILTVVFGSIAFSDTIRGAGKWVTGDYHTHTYLTDGSNTEKEVIKQAFDTFKLDWMANSEHGGTSARDAMGSPFPKPVWRWITLGLYSYPIVQDLRTQYPDKKLIQGVEWNVPTHEHASVGIVTNEPKAVADFEYQFDASDGAADNLRANEGLTKTNVTATDAISGVAWLEQNYKDSSYMIVNHPSRQLKYSAADFRDLTNAGPDVVVGFESMPGHQKESARGGYSSSNPKALTYGGADYILAQVGGLWDSLLGEGRRFWAFASSDFHATAGDFWPGEYSKTHTFATGTDYQSLINGFRSGDQFVTTGDLVSGLDFKVSSHGDGSATMGDTLAVDNGDTVKIQIRFKSPRKNNNGDTPVVDHIDLIAGDVTGMAQPGTAAYTSDTNSSTKIIATFTKKDWGRESEDGWNVINYQIKNAGKDQYFRLRGTNMGFNVANQTDANGNPLVDSLVGPNTPAQAYADLWMYSNPVFVSVK